MIKRDLLKEIENGLKIVKETIDKGILENNTEEAFRIIDKKLKEMVGLNIDTINTVSFDSIKSMINAGFENNTDKYIALGMLLKFEGYLFAKDEDVSSEIFYYLTAISAFNEGFYNDDSYLSNYKDEINELISEVIRYKLTDEEGTEVKRAIELVK